MGVFKKEKGLQGRDERTKMKLRGTDIHFGKVAPKT